MHAKTFEIRDAATFIPVLAVNLKGECIQDVYLLRRCGYGEYPSEMASYVMLTALQGGGIANCDSHDWPSQTMQVAHEYILAHWHELHSGDVVDVEHILGIRKEPRISEKYDSENLNT